MKETKNSVLVVDDETANCIALNHILGQEHTVYVAKNGTNAINIAKKNIPDVILLDVLMPDLDGFEVLSILKNTEETKNIPVIFISGLTNNESIERGLTLGAEDYISKPFHPSIVQLRVRQMIKIQNLLERIRQIGER
jgi:PleD family two-component response regulator